MCLSQNASPLYFLKYEDLSVLIKCNRLHKYIPERLVNGSRRESLLLLSVPSAFSFSLPHPPSLYELCVLGSSEGSHVCCMCSTLFGTNSDKDREFDIIRNCCVDVFKGSFEIALFACVFQGLYVGILLWPWWSDSLTELTMAAYQWDSSCTTHKQRVI